MDVGFNVIYIIYIKMKVGKSEKTTPMCLLVPWSIMTLMTMTTTKIVP